MSHLADHFRFIAPSDNTSIIIGQNNDGPMLKRGLEDSLARGIEIITISDSDKEGRWGVLDQILIEVEFSFFIISCWRGESC